MAPEPDAATSRQDREELVTTVRHEVRTPLTVILVSAQALAERGEDLDADTRTLIYRSMRHNSERLLKVMDRLLDG